MSSYDNTGQPNAFKIVDGSAPGGHIYVSQASAHTIDAGGGPSLNIIAGISTGAWANSQAQCLISEVYKSISGFGNVSGPKFFANGLSLINVAGRGVNYLPGNVAGTLAGGSVLT